MVKSLVEHPDTPGSQMSFTCPIHASWQLSNHPVLAAQAGSAHGEERVQKVKMARATTPAVAPEQKLDGPSYADSQHAAGRKRDEPKLRMELERC